MGNLVKKYRGILAYLFWGVVSMVVNILTYQISYELLGTTNMVATLLAWVFAVIVAYLSNKVFVFGTRFTNVGGLTREFTAFLVARIGTGLIDVGIMYLAVDCLNMEPLLWKTATNIIVVILNYVFSKIYVFRGYV